MHIKKSILIYFVFTLLFFTCGNSQTYDLKFFLSEFNLKFESSDQKKFDKALELLNSGDALIKKAEKEFASLTEEEKEITFEHSYQSMVTDIIDGSKDITEGHMLLIEVFKERIEAFWEKMRKENHYAIGMEKGKYYEKQFKKHLEMAENKLDQMDVSDRYEWVYTKYKEVLDFELLAVCDLCRALQIYQDYPVEYNYGWENDITLEEVIALKKGHIINEPPDDLFDPKPDTIKKDTVKKVDMPIAPIIFRVQIAAHTEPLTQAYLNTIYTGHLPVREIQEDNWYKYQIGEFSSFEEASDLLEECQVKKAFIVAYQSGNKLRIRDAIELIGTN